MPHYSLVLTLAAALIALPAAGQDTQRFDLERTIRAALASSSTLQILRRQADIDDTRVRQAGAPARLGVTGSAAATRYDAATSVAIGGGPRTQILPDHSEVLSIGLTQRLDLFGQVRAAVGQARLQTLADRLALATAERRLSLDATEAYLALLRAQRQRTVADAAVTAAQAQRDQAQVLNDAGVGQKLDLLRARTTLAQAVQARERAERDVANARAAFNDLVGQPLDAPVALDEPASPDTPRVEVEGIVLADRIDRAQRERDDILQTEAALRAAEQGVRLARTGDQPQVAVSAAGNIYPTTSFQFPRERTAAVTVGVTIPFADGGLNRARVDEARLRVENARTQRDQLRSAIALELTQDYRNLLTAARQIASATTALEQARAARELAQVRYAGQVGLFLEVTDAQAALTRAEAAQVDAVADYLLARARFESAAGRKD
jgi:outer membrane protein TolC